MFCVKTLRNGSVEDKTIGNVLPRTTETGRPRIQKYALQLILVPGVNDLGHVDLFVRPKKVNSHVVTFFSYC